MPQHRVLPVRPEDLTDEQRAFLRPFTDTNGHYANIFGVLVRHLPLLKAWRNFGLYTMHGSLVPAAMREALILRVAVNCGCEYEWHHHVPIGREAGMTEAQIDAIRAGEPGGDADLDLGVRVADALDRDRNLSPELWDALSARLGLEGTIDAVFTVGAYTALAMGLNTCGVRIEEHGEQAPGRPQ